MTATFAAIVAAARSHAGLTAAEFDYALTSGPNLGARAYMALDASIYTLANEGQPQVTQGAHEIRAERSRRADALRQQYADEIVQLIADAEAKAYTGWSTASAGPVRYAR